MTNFDQKDANGFIDDLATEERAEQLLNDANVIGELTSGLASADEDALNIAIQQAIGGDITRLNQMYWGAAIAQAKAESTEVLIDYDDAA